MAEQPFLGLHCSSPWHEEGARKGTLNIACSTHFPGQLTAAGGDPTSCGRNNKKASQKLRVTPLKLATWNVRTLLDRDDSVRPQRRTALVATDLAKYDIDIAALSETRFSGVGELTERGAGYTFFWSRRGPEERCEAGVGFAVKSSR